MPKMIKNDDWSAEAMRVKRLLDDIIIQTYGNDCSSRFPSIFKFSVDLMQSNPRARVGDYRMCPDEKGGWGKIRLYFADMIGWPQFVEEAIYQLSKHVQTIQIGYTKSNDILIDIFSTLMRSALDMNILSADELQNLPCPNRDAIKMHDIVACYSPKNVLYKPGTRVYVYNCFDKKNLLKSREYRYNPIDKAWYKEFPDASVDDEVSLLEKEGFLKQHIKTCPAARLILHLTVMISVSNVPFDKRHRMRELGYQWEEKKKAWRKKVFFEAMSETELNEIQSFGELVNIKRGE